MNTNILDYRVTDEGNELWTDAIQSAIDACATSGGGRVVIPAGHYVSGTIWLKSHVELYLEHGARLVASTNQEDYNAPDAYMQNYGCEVEEWLGQHFILAIEQEDVAITGSGVIDGSGDAFFEEPWEPQYSYWMKGVAQAKDKEKLRPGQLICFVECKHVLVEDVTITNTPCWACFWHGCDVVTAKGVKILNPPYFCNTDGLDIDSCRYVTVSDCIILTGDDAIAIRNAAHRLRDKTRSCEYITITNCVLSTGACGMRFGVGKGVIRHVQVSNLTVEQAGALFCLISGYVGSGHITIEDVHIQNVSAVNVSHPFEIQDESEAGIKKVSLRDVSVEARYGSHIITPRVGTISDITLENVSIDIKAAKNAKHVDASADRAVLSCQGVDGLSLNRVRVRVDEEFRAMWDEDVRFTDCTDVEERF